MTNAPPGLVSRRAWAYWGLMRVPAEELGPALIDRIDRLHAARSRAQALPPDNPIGSLAEEAADGGEYDRAERLLAVALDQIRAVNLVEIGNADGAIAALNEALQQLGTVSAKGPVDDRIVQGYIYKTLAQAYSTKGNKVREDQSVAKAMEIFDALAHETRPDLVMHMPGTTCFSPSISWQSGARFT